MSEYKRLKSRKAQYEELARRKSLKKNPLVRYVLDRGLISARKVCEILDCDIEDVTDGI